MEKIKCGEAADNSGMDGKPLASCPNDAEFTATLMYSGKLLFFCKEHKKQASKYHYCGRVRRI